MLRYALDNLGWFEFEGLTQSLLKARLGLGVEAWGGTGDLGRDAYYEGALKYPSNEITSGTFLFQCKFVESANAAGAKPGPAIVKAVRAECARFRGAVATGARGTHVQFAPRPPIVRNSPSHYSLITNARLAARLRSEIARELASTFPNAAIHVHDGTDICTWLDVSPEVVRAFPLLWGLRNIDDLLRRWVNSDLLARSRAALAEAKDVAGVFVPTQPYSRALEVLGKHHFVVLEGPPEMGKTAIGRIISLSMVAREWEALECRGPADVERGYDEERRQVFIADDFFGRTEYDPRSVSDWQRELPHILRLLDGGHWLILTTRAHLLNLAKRSLDIAGLGRSFPAPGEIVVDASQLTSVEKARILYRHLKHRNLPAGVRMILRICASSIVKNPHFTPERIRRFVSEGLRTLTEREGELVTLDAVMSVASQSLSNPTQQMKISFRNLRPSEKWLLFAFVESGSSLTWRHHEQGLMEAYVRLCPIDVREPFEEVIAAMSGAFVRRLTDLDRIEWVHPSCRDLAIAELGRDVRDRQRFLEMTSAPGLELALSIGGGSQGSVDYPLLITADDWKLIARRAVESPKMSASILSHAMAIHDMRVRTRLPPDERLEAFLFGDLWPAVLNEANTNGWKLELLSLYCRGEVWHRVSSPRPDIRCLWEETKELALDGARAVDEVIWDRFGAFESLAKIAKLIEEHPVLFDSQVVVDDVREVLSEWVEAIEAETQSWFDTTNWDRQMFEGASSGYAQLSHALKVVEGLQVATPWADELKRGRLHFESQSENFSREDRWEDDDDRLDADTGRDAVVEELFKDL
jgi:hypothetical protein